MKNAYLIHVGDYLPVNPRRIANKLNALQHFIRFTALERTALPQSSVDVRSDAGLVRATRIRLAAEQACVAQGTVLGEDGILIAFTSARIADHPDEERWSDAESEYFGYYRTKYSPDVPRGRAVLSTALWVQRYESVAYRTTEQFIASSIAAFLCDHFIDGTLVHYEFRNCNSDFCGDFDTVAVSVKKARLCDECQRKLAAASRGAGMAGFDAAISAMLRYVRRPRPEWVLHGMQQSPVLSLMLMGVLLSLFTGALYDLLQRSSLATMLSSAAFLILFLGFMVKEHYFPGRRLG